MPVQLGSLTPGWLNSPDLQISRAIGLNETHITDAELHLQAMKRLSLLNLMSTQVTDAGLAP